MRVICIALAGSLLLTACTDTPRSRPVPPGENVYPNLAEVPPRVHPTTNPEERDEILENLEIFQKQAQAMHLQTVQ